MSDYLGSIGVEGTTLQGQAEQDVVAGWFDGTRVHTFDGAPSLNDSSRLTPEILRRN